MTRDKGPETSELDISGGPVKRQPYRPNALEGAVLLLRLIESKKEEAGKEATRFRVAESTLKRIFGRHRIPPAFMLEVEEWLLRAGWALFYGGSYFGVIQTKNVLSWSRLGSKRLTAELEAVAQGTYDFQKLYKLLQPSTQSLDHNEDQGEGGD